VCKESEQGLTLTQKETVFYQRGGEGLEGRKGETTQGCMEKEKRLQQETRSKDRRQDKGEEISDRRVRTRTKHPERGGLRSRERDG